MTSRLIKWLVGAVLSFVCVVSGWGAQGANVTLAWNPPQAGVGGAPLTALVGYRIFYGPASGQYEGSMDVGNVTQATLPDLDQHRTYYIAVKARMADGTTGTFSEEIVWANDANVNSLSDAWELQHFGTLGAPRTDADADFDGDGVSNLREFVAGTDPADPQSRAMLKLIETDEPLAVAFEAKDAVGFGFAGRVRVYTLEACDDLNHPEWAAVPGLERMVGNGRDVQCVLAALDSASKFYRLLITLE